MISEEELDAWLYLDRELSLLECYRRNFNLSAVKE